MTLLDVLFSQNASEVNSPRACVTVENVPYALKKFKIEKNAHGATNTANFRVSIKSNPDWTSLLYAKKSDNAPIYIGIYAGFPENPSSQPSIAGLSRRFFGILDNYEPDNLKDTEFTCRSIAAPLTTDSITTAVQNLSTTAFIQQICAKYNIPVKIDPSLKPTTLASIYAQEFVVGMKNLKKWDIIQRASIFDDCDAWEDDGTLYYYHPWNVPRKIIPFTYGADLHSFIGHHAPQFSRLIRVQVHSYSAKIRTSTSVKVQSIIDSVLGPGVAVSVNSKVAIARPKWGTNAGTTTTYYDNGAVKQSTWTSQGGSAGSNNAAISESGIELYDFYLPNLTYDQCNALCRALWRQLSMHEYQGTFQFAMTKELLPLVNVASEIALQGYTMPKFNTRYWPRTMDESFDGPDDEESGDPAGWQVESHGVNHTLPLGGGV